MHRLLPRLPENDGPAAHRLPPITDPETLSKLELFQIFAALLVAIGVALEFVAAFVARPVQHRVEAARETEIARANERAAEANHQAAVLNERAAKAELALAEANLKLEELRLRQAPRRLKCDNFRELLKGTRSGEVELVKGGWRSPKRTPEPYAVHVSVLFRPDDEEAFAFAVDLHKALDGARWDAYPLRSFPGRGEFPTPVPNSMDYLDSFPAMTLYSGGKSLSGLTIFTAGATYSGPDAVTPPAILAAALRSCGHAVTVVEDVTLPFQPIVRVSVGQKP